MLEAFQAHSLKELNPRKNQSPGGTKRRKIRPPKEQRAKPFDRTESWQVVSLWDIYVGGVPSLSLSSGQLEYVVASGMPLTCGLTATLCLFLPPETPPPPRLAPELYSLSREAADSLSLSVLSRRRTSGSMLFREMNSGEDSSFLPNSFILFYFFFGKF